MKSLLVLASSSPRRIEFVKLLGLPVHSLVPSVDETPLKNEVPKDMVKRLAKLKAEAVVPHIDKLFWNTHAKGFKKIVVLAADTTVVSPAGKNLGKPQNEAEAVKMIYALQGKVHFVSTAFCLIELNKSGKWTSKVHIAKTDVKFRRLTKTECKQYVNKGESMDKAGAYAAQGYGQCLIEEIKGSYTNVVGLPMTQLACELSKKIKGFTAFV